MLQETGEGENDSYKYGIAAMQGWRTDMVGGVGGGACVHGAPPPPPPPCYPTSLRELAHASRHSLTQPPTIAAPQEDAHAAVLDLPEGGPRSALFAVLDGHGGAEVARFVAAHVVSDGGLACWYT